MPLLLKLLIEKFGQQMFWTQTKMIVISDGDIIKNQVIQQQSGMFPLPLGYDRFTQKYFDNKKFILNSVNYLLGDEELINIRNKEFKIRLLDKVKIADEKLYRQLLNTIGPLLLIIFLGLIINLIKRMRYLYFKTLITYICLSSIEYSSIKVSSSVLNV